MSEKQELRPIVRILSDDLKGNKHAVVALSGIRGVGYRFSSAILRVLKIPFDKKIGYFTSEDVKTVEEAIKNPATHGIPAWMMNRRKDVETGKDMHLNTTDLRWTLENDLKRLKKTKSYRGLRHAWGLTVRGQRTKSNFRNKKSKQVGSKKARR